MSNDDFLLSNAQKRLQVLQASKQRLLADLAENQATGDDYAAQEQIGALAHIEIEERGIIKMANDYVAARNPPPAPPATDAEFLARSPERMTGADVDKIFAKSKYYTPDQWSDPNVAERVRQGFAEVQRRRTRGE